MMSEETETPEETQTLPLDAWHRAQGARMVPFAGYEMPIQYEGIVAEHEWTRRVSFGDRDHFGGSVSAAQEVVMGEEMVLSTAKAMVEFQDADADGAISGDELRATLERWLASLKRYVREYRKLRAVG